MQDSISDDSSIAVNGRKLGLKAIRPEELKR
jgi:hypothetical protein